MLKSSDKLTKEGRIPISKEMRVRIYRRDRWLCRWCAHPVIFAPVMKYMEQFVRHRGYLGELAYNHQNWSRDKAPLLDELGAVIDHIHAHSLKGTNDESNLATSCNKCNTRKSASSADDFSIKSPLRRVRGKYGEPQYWDGLSAVFVVLIEQVPEAASQSDLEWLQALKSTE